jgi:hypothetical protein
MVVNCAAKVNGSTKREQDRRQGRLLWRAWWATSYPSSHFVGQAQFQDLGLAHQKPWCTG